MTQAVGTIVQMQGAAGGWRASSISQSCINIPFGGYFPTLELLCQAATYGASLNGDSGGPVFFVATIGLVRH